MTVITRIGLFIHYISISIKNNGLYLKIFIERKQYKPGRLCINIASIYSSKTIIHSLRSLPSMGQTKKPQVTFSCLGFQHAAERLTKRALPCHRAFRFVCAHGRSGNIVGATLAAGRHSRHGGAKTSAIIDQAGARRDQSVVVPFAGARALQGRSIADPRTATADLVQ